VEMDLNAFNGWMLNPVYDSTKTIAGPYTTFPEFPGQIEISAFNYEYPITIRWDVGLYSTPGLPPLGYILGGELLSDYFFWNSNESMGHSFIMGADYEDSVVVMAQDPSMFLFPLTVFLGVGSTLNIEEHERSQGLALFPTPAEGRVRIRTTGIIEEVACSPPMDGLCYASVL
jgi:hypothetical protein